MITTRPFVCQIDQHFHNYHFHIIFILYHIYDFHITFISFFSSLASHFHIISDQFYSTFTSLSYYHSYLHHCHSVSRVSLTPLSQHFYITFGRLSYYFHISLCHHFYINFTSLSQHVYISTTLLSNHFQTKIIKGTLTLVHNLDTRWRYLADSAKFAQCYQFNVVIKLVRKT